MDRRHRVAVVAAAAFLCGIAGCGGEEEAAPVPSAEEAVPVPSADELAAALLSTEDLPGVWVVNPGPEDGALPASGVVPEEVRDLLPRLELCPAASVEARAAAAALQWQAFRQLDQEEDDPIEPPADRSGHLVFVQEFLAAAEPAVTEGRFTSLRDGMAACLGELPAGDEGPGVAEEMPLPDLGDDRYGVRTTLEEQGGDAEWLFHQVFVREGAVLLVVDVVDIRMGEVEPLFTRADVDAIAATAVDRLSSALLAGS